jgi:hypothetical protein
MLKQALARFLVAKVVSAKINIIWKASREKRNCMEKGGQSEVLFLHRMQCLHTSIPNLMRCGI